jgi:hypothetical protein
MAQNQDRSMSMFDSPSQPTRPTAQRSASVFIPQALPHKKPQALDASLSTSWRINSSIDLPSSGPHRESTLLDQTSSELLRACQHITELETDLHRSNHDLSAVKQELLLQREHNITNGQDMVRLEEQVQQLEGQLGVARMEAEETLARRANLSEAAQQGMYEQNAEFLRRRNESLEEQLQRAHIAKCAPCCIVPQCPAWLRA